MNNISVGRNTRFYFRLFGINVVGSFLFLFFILTLSQTPPMSVFNCQLSVDAGVLAVASGDVCVEIWRPRK